eukprot:evm.model.scf_2172EXC.3 EVM.evm.TU.scf_2172EXC.3   scf_2172EXC:8145-8444(-)
MKPVPPQSDTLEDCDLDSENEENNNRASTDESLTVDGSSQGTGDDGSNGGERECGPIKRRPRCRVEAAPIAARGDASDVMNELKSFLQFKREAHLKEAAK